MTFSGITSSLTQSAKSLNGLVTKMGSQLQTQFGPTINSVKDSIDVLKAGQDVVSTVVKDVSGQNVTIRDIQKGALDFDQKWDAFAKEVNEKFNTAPAGSQADVMETFARSHFGDDVYNLGSAIKNQLPGVLDGMADYKDAVNNMLSDSQTAEEAARKIQNGVEKIVKATEKVAQSLNNAVEICTGNGLPVLDELSQIGSYASVANLNKVLSLGVSGATVATAGSQLKESLKNKDLRGVTDALAKGATSVNSLMADLSNLVPGFTNAQIPTQISNSIKRLQDGQAVYDAAGAILTALVADASGPTTVASLAALTTHFNQNWNTFSSKIDALFQVTPSNGQQAVLETVAKSMFDDNVFYAAGAIKRQLPGVFSGVAGVQDAIKQFSGSYRNPIEAATKIRNGVEKMVQAIEKISQSLNNMIKYYQGQGDITKGIGLPLLDALGKIGDSKGIKALDTALRIGGGAAAIAGNADAVVHAIKDKDIPGAIAAVKKTIDDAKKLTKKGNYKDGGNQGSATGLPKNSSKTSNSSDKTKQQSQKSKNDLSLASADSYVCSGAMMKCSMGTSQAKLTILPTRTVYLTGQPMANISDHLSMVNLAPFGNCRSMGFPATASATASAQGTLTPMPCMHNTPFPWMRGKNDYLIKGQPALLKSSKCQCMWGGIISLINDGQTTAGTVDLYEKPKEFFFLKTKTHSLHDDGQMTGAASNPFSSGFYIAKTLKNVYSMDEKTKKHFEELESLYDRLERLEYIPENQRDSLAKSIEKLYDQYFNIKVFSTASKNGIPGKTNPVGSGISFGGSFIDFADESGFSIQRKYLSNEISVYENAEGKVINENQQTKSNNFRNPVNEYNKYHADKTGYKQQNKGYGVMGNLPSLEIANDINNERKSKKEELIKRKNAIIDKIKKLNSNPNKSSEQIKMAVSHWQEELKGVENEIWKIDNGL